MLRTSRRPMAAVAAALALLLVAVSTAGAARPRVAPARPEAKPFEDVRMPDMRKGDAPGAAPLRALAPAARDARARLVRRLGGETVLNADPLTATPRMLGRLDGTLTGPHAGDPADVALGYVDDNAAALGLSPSDVSSLHLADRASADGVTYLRWRQEVDGVPVLDNQLQAAVDGDGRVVSVTGAPRPDLPQTIATPSLSAADARSAVARDVGVDHPATVASGPSGPRQETTFSTGDRAALVLFGDTGGTRLAWQVTYRADASAWYVSVVDAATGAILRRANMVDSLVDASVFDNYPGAQFGGDQRTVSLDPYLTDPVNGTTLTGPFAHAWSDIDDDNVAAPSEEVDPRASAGGPYRFNEVKAADNPDGACDGGHRCSWNGASPGSWAPNRKQNAVQVFWSVNRFHDHLAAPPIGFDAFTGATAVRVNTDDGANGVPPTPADPPPAFPDGDHLDNANMTTLPGQAPVMQMYLFIHIPGTPPSSVPFRDVNGGDDASIVYHEYTHGMSNRLIADGTAGGGLQNRQSAAMGEGWSDWYAKDFLVDQFPALDTAADGEIDMGAYVDTGHNIRTQPLDCSVGAPTPPCLGGYTYGDFNALAGAVDPHNAGEIWGETLWDIRKLLGSQVAEAIITGGMRLTPVEPSFLDARNAILQADSALFGGIHVNTLWGVFANRGMGFSASSAGSDDPNPVERFDLPPVTPPAPAQRSAGGATPQAVPASAVARVQVPSRPTARVDRSAARGRASVTFGCSSACSVTATMTVSRATARSAGLGRTTHLARVTRRLAGAGRRTFALTMSTATLRKARARGLRALGVTVTVSIRDSRGQTRALKRALRVRIG
jgi:extracellular elastinolytic metalloproteinase